VGHFLRKEDYMSVLYFRNESGEFVEVPAIVGRSAYQTAVKNGFDGTEEEWLATLKGEPGYTPQKGIDYFDGYTPQKGLDYFDGKDGLDGHTPQKGADYWTDADKKEIGDYANAQGANVVSVTADRTLTANDFGKFLRVDAEATIMVPALTVGAEIEIFRNTSGAVTILADGVAFALAGNGAVTTESQGIIEQYTSIVLKQITEAVWSIQGAI
jgi:hypothetical protein